MGGTGTGTRATGSDPYIPPTEAVDGVRQRLKDQSVTYPWLHDDDIDLAIKTAVGEHSVLLPREAVEEITGDGTSYIDLSDLTYWTPRFSTVLSIEYPAGDPATDEDPGDDIPLARARGWQYVETSDAEYIYLPADMPSASEEVRIRYTAQWVYTASTSTVLAEHEAALLDLAASYAAGLASARAALGKDGATRTTAATPSALYDRLVAVGAYYRRRYFAVMNLSDPQDPNMPVKAASKIMNWQADPSHVYGRMTHIPWRR